MDSMKVGDVAYQTGSPAKCGVIVKVERNFRPKREWVPDTPENRAKYQWKRGDSDICYRQTFPNGAVMVGGRNGTPHICVNTGEQYEVTPTYTVVGKNGKVVESKFGWMSMQYLVEDHERKAVKMRKLLEDMKAAVPIPAE